jgi:hypothetical protein
MESGRMGSVVQCANSKPAQNFGTHLTDGKKFSSFSLFHIQCIQVIRNYN